MITSANFTGSADYFKDQIIPKYKKTDSGNESITYVRFYEYTV